jgi:hypothetical protein
VKLLVSFDCQIIKKRDFNVLMQVEFGNIKRGITYFTKDFGLRNLNAGNVGRFRGTPKIKSVSPNLTNLSITKKKLLTDSIDIIYFGILHYHQETVNGQMT